jgi:hypothetical protein
MLSTLAHIETCPTGQSAGTMTWSPSTLAATLRNVRDALREGLAAYRKYEHLRSRGTSHDAALKHAFGLSPHGA